MKKRLLISIETRKQGLEDTARAILNALKEDSLYDSGNKYRALSADEATITNILDTGTDRRENEHEKRARELHKLQEGRMTLEEATMLTHPNYTWVSDEGQLVSGSLDLYYHKPQVVIVYDGDRLVVPEASEFPNVPSRSQGSMQFIHSLSGFRRFTASPKDALKAVIELNYLN